MVDVFGVIALGVALSGIQFNIVVSINEASAPFWKKYGFKIIGTTSSGFWHGEPKG